MLLSRGTIRMMVDHPQRSDEAVERMFAAVRHLREESGPVTLGEHYVRAVELTEALQENVVSADKTWVLETIRRSRRQWASAVRVR